MAFASDIRGFEANITQRLIGAAKNFAAARAQNHAFKMTLRELSALSDRELDDLGLHRSQIIAVARQATYGR